MEPFVISDINQWSAFFKKLLEVHSSLRGSALSKVQKTQRWQLSLINNATTIGKNGQLFQYYSAVDLGRGPVTTRFGGYIRFTGRSGEVVTTTESSATSGYNITAQAMAKVHATFDIELHTTFNKWLLSHQEAAIAAGEISSAIQLNPVPILSEPVEVTPKRGIRIQLAQENAYTAVFNKLLAKSASTFNAKDIIRQSEAAGVLAGAKEANRVAALSSGLINEKAFKPITGAAQSNPAIQKLVKIPNWYALAGIFAKTTGDQIEHSFKPLTPTRRETGSFKLVYVGGAEMESLPPSTGGDLIKGYKLITNSELQRLIGE